MPERAKLYPAQMRWSNRITGLEFAPLDSEIGGDARRLPRLKENGMTDGSPGRLLQDELERDGYGEGCGVIVIALPRRMRDEEIVATRDRIQVALARDAEAGS